MDKDGTILEDDVLSELVDFSITNDVGVELLYQTLWISVLRRSKVCISFLKMFIGITIYLLFSCIIVVFLLFR